MSSIESFEAVAIGARLWFTLVELATLGCVVALTPRLADAPAGEDAPGAD